MEGNKMGLAKTGIMALAGLFLMATTAFADGDAAKGEGVFKKCKACHKIGEGAKNATGPLLNNVIGRVAGTVDGYSYKPSMVAAGAAGLIWTEELVADYLEDPKAFLRAFLNDSAASTKMTLKLKKEDDREDVAAYLATLSAAATPASD